MSQRLYLYIDGACRGNPGQGGAGAAFLTLAGEIVSKHKKFLGECTNNIAEYEALLLGLQEAKKQKVKKIEIRADSELLVRQINGQYKVKNPNLQKRFIKAMKALKAFQYEMVHVRREKNKIADQLANEAIDEHEAILKPMG